MLPVRGAMAAAMLCLPASEPAPHAALFEAHHEGGHEGTHHGHSAGEAHAAAGHDNGAGGHHEGGLSGQDGCNLCSAFCSITPLASATPSVATPLDLATTAFPDLSAPAPSFLSGGQERPPRSI